MRKRVAKTAGVRKGAVVRVGIMAGFESFKRGETEPCYEAYVHETSDNPQISTLELVGPTVPGQTVKAGAFELIRWTGLVGYADGQLCEEGWASVAGNGDPVCRPCSDEEARAFLLARSPLLAKLFMSKAIVAGNSNKGPQP